MEMRKIILFGKSAFCITLPQSWAKKHKLQKGDTIGIIETQRNSLEIRPADSPSALVQEQNISIDIMEMTNSEIAHQMLSAYLNGYSIITFTGTNPEKESFIRSQVQKYMATEVMESKTGKVVVQVFWDMSNIDLESIMTRIGHICKNLFNESMELLNENVTIDEIKERGVEAEKQVLLARRVIKCAINNAAVAQKFNLSSLELLYASYITYFLGKTAEHTVKISGILYENQITTKISQNRQAAKMMEVLLSQVLEYYDTMLKSFSRKDIAHQNINDYEDIEDAVNGFRQKNNQQWAPVIAEYLNIIIGKIKEAEFMMISMENAPKYNAE